MQVEQEILQSKKKKTNTGAWLHLTVVFTWSLFHPRSPTWCPYLILLESKSTKNRSVFIIEVDLTARCCFSAALAHAVQMLNLRAGLQTSLLHAFAVFLAKAVQVHQKMEKLFLKVAHRRKKVFPISITGPPPPPHGHKKMHCPSNLLWLTVLKLPSFDFYLLCFKPVKTRDLVPW